MEEEKGFYTTPAINLICACLVNMKFYLTDDSVVTKAVPIPEFYVEKFLNEYNRLKEYYFLSYSMEDFEIDFPLTQEYFIMNLGSELDISKCEHIEIEWAINFEPSGFARYVQGFELV